MKISYKAKILIVLLSVSGIIFFSVLAYYFNRFQKIVYTDSTKMVDAYVRENANQISAEFNTDMGVCRSLANSIASAQTFHNEKRWNEYTALLKEIDEHSKGYLNVWASFELSTFRKDYNKGYGRRVLNVYTLKKEQFINDYYKNIEGDDIGSSYYNIKLSKQEAIIEPYLFSLTGEKKDEQLVTSICVPILKNNKYIGLAGVDIGLQRYKQLTANIKPYTESISFLIAFDGTIITHPNDTLINKKFQEVYPEINQTYTVQDQIKKGTNFSFSLNNNQSPYYSFAPINIGETKTPWSLVTITPEKVIFSETRKIIRHILYLGLLGFSIIGLSIWLIVQRLTNNIKKFTQFSNAVNEGELTAILDIQRNDELGILANAMRNMAKSLRNIVNQLKISSKNINEASILLNNNSQNLSHTASKQAAEVEEISSALEQMVEFINQNAENAKVTEEIALQSKERVKNSSDASTKATNSIQHIANKNSLITDIAFQTNILALNAAVEAARAGEYGRGFSVVASEVRKLAERSKEAADEINSLSQVMVTDSEIARKMLNNVLPDMENTTSLVQQISISSNEQAEGVNQINASIRELNDITQNNASSAEHLAASAENLSAQAQQLEELISSFKS